MKTKQKRSVALAVSAVLGGLYSLYIIAYFGGGLSGASGSTEVISGAIATALVMPHMLCVVVAVIFNAIAFFNNRQGFALVGAILYAVAAVVFLMYAVFVLPSMILSFVGYAKLRKLHALSQNAGWQGE